MQPMSEAEETVAIPAIFAPAHRPQWTALERRLKQLQAEGRIAADTSLPALYAVLQPEEAAMMRSFLDLHPEDYGIRMPFIGMTDVPDDLVAVPTDMTTEFAKMQATSYMPAPVYRQFMAMRSAFAADHPGRFIGIETAYRSPAFQLVTLVYYLVNVHDYDLPETLTQVALPAYSWHCSAERTALDLLNVDGQPTDEAPQEFAGSAEYRWLQAHAAGYRFHETYPRDNQTGIMWEPWHWQYIPEQA